MKGLNTDVIDRIGYFLNKINDRSLYFHGYSDSYDDGGDKALGENVEYFHPAITLDSRMRYIAENIVYNNDIDNINKVCNIMLTHFYGGLGIIQTMTRNADPKTAAVDFYKLASNKNYYDELNTNLVDAKDWGLPVYGTTELRTSLFGASNAYIAEKYKHPKNANLINIAAWVAGFIDRGLIEECFNQKSLEDLYYHLISIEGIGPYYGYNEAVSQSLNPVMGINHDERFSVPGPGAKYTLDRLFDQKKIKMDYGEQIVWFRENYRTYIGDINMHPFTHNIEVGDKKVFSEEQDELKTYGCEVGLCQFGVYDRLSLNHNLINRRKIGSIDEAAQKGFFERKRPPNRLPSQGEKGYQVTLFDLI